MVLPVTRGQFSQPIRLTGPATRPAHIAILIVPRKNNALYAAVERPPCHFGCLTGLASFSSTTMTFGTTAPLLQVPRGGIPTLVVSLVASEIWPPPSDLANSRNVLIEVSMSASVLALGIGSDASSRCACANARHAVACDEFVPKISRLPCGQVQMLLT